MKASGIEEGDLVAVLKVATAYCGMTEQQETIAD
jgi:hypothetical protein